MYYRNIVKIKINCQIFVFFDIINGIYKIIDSVNIDFIDIFY